MITHLQVVPNQESLNSVWANIVPSDVLIHPTFLSPFTMMPQTICNSNFKLHIVPQEQLSIFKQTNANAFLT